MTAQRGAATGASDGESAAFLQKRVGLFGLVGTGLGGFFLAVRVALAGDRLPIEVRTPSFLWHLAGTSALFGVWAATRGRPLSIPLVHRVEGVGLVLSSVAYVMMGSETPPEIRPDHIVVLALTLGFLARAVYVPSSAARTATLGAVISLPLLVGTYWVYARWDPPSGYPFPKVAVQTATFVETAAWWFLSTLLGTFASRVLYGLREEASAARKLGQYTLEEKLGEGGMGLVYRARHAMLRRPTAVKLLLPERAGREGVVRFEREVQLTAQLSHPHTVTVYDYGRTDDGIFYYAMELLDGATLAEVVDVSGAQPPGRVAAVVDAVAGALAEAHAVGLIHRDIKPANIMLCRQGGLVDFAKVLDFGLVKELQSDGNEAASLTQANVLAGTPLYMAPESITDPAAVDARSDLYALGAVAYFLITGQHVFTGRTSVEVCSHHLHTRPVPPSERLGRPVPAALEAIVLRCLEKRPEDRPPHAVALRDAVLGAPELEPWTEVDGARWWATHEPELRARRATSVPAEGSRTLAIDLARRARGRAASG